MYSDVQYIGKITFRAGHETVHITLEDGSAGTIACEIEMAFSDWTRATLGNFGNVPCQYHASTKLMGAKREAARLVVPVSRVHPDDDEIRAIMAIIEVDGWRGRSEDLGNPHNYKCQEDGSYQATVVMTRYLDADGNAINLGEDV